MADSSVGMGGALFGVVVTGLLLALVGVIVMVTGTGWIEVLMPPVVTGAIVALIGLNLATAATGNYQPSRGWPPSPWPRCSSPRWRSAA